MAIEAEALRDAALFDAQSINDSDRVISVFAAPEWDELSIDGKEWVRAIIAETLSRHRSALAEDTARAAEGARLVPTKPTLDMQNAGWREIASQGLQIEEIDVAPIYAAMLAAAPALPLDKEAAR